MAKTRITQKQNNKEKKPTKTRQRKKQNTKHDDTDQEDSNSTTNLSQSDSLYCPTSAKKPMKIDSTRRASLRLSKKKNLIETGIVDLSRCSNPPRSKEHLRESPSRYLKKMEPTLRYKEIEKGGKCIAIRNADEHCLELEDIVAKMTEGKEAEKEVPLADSLGDFIAKMREGEVGEQEEPLTEQPADADNELESRECSLSNGQHIILDNFEVVSARIASFNTPRETGMTGLSKLRKHFSTLHDMQQLHDLAYQVPQSSQVESPSRYLKQGEPSLRHEEIEKDGRVAAEENLGVGIGEKQVPLVERPISMVSLGITEFFKNMAAIEDDEADSRRFDMDTIERYQVKPESMPILRKILTKYGDIAKNSTASTMLLSGSLETICGIISQMQGKHLRQIKEDFLIHNIGLVEKIKSVGIDIEWLHVLLKDILDTKQENFGKLKEEKESNKKIVDDVERRLTECRERQRELSDLLKSACDEEVVYKEALSKAKDECTRITQNMKSTKAKFERFLDCFPVDLLF